MSTFKPSAALLRSLDRKPSNPELIRAYLSGSMPTKGPASPANLQSGGAQHFLSAFEPRRIQRRSDPSASKKRRRMLGGSSGLPDTIRHHYTEGERAALFVVAGEVRKRGYSDLPIDRIAATAGVGRTTVQNALREARRLGHVKVELRPRRGQKNDTNIVRIVSKEWLAWLKRGPSTGFKRLSTTKRQLSETGVLKYEQQKHRRSRTHGESVEGAYEGESGRCRVTPTKAQTQSFRRE